MVIPCLYYFIVYNIICSILFQSSIGSPPPLDSCTNSPGSSPSSTLSDYSNITQTTMLSTNSVHNTTPNVTPMVTPSVTPDARATINEDVLRQLISPPHNAEANNYSTCTTADLMSNAGDVGFFPPPSRKGWHLGGSQTFQAPAPPAAFSAASNDDSSLRLTRSEVEVNAPLSRNQSLLMGLDLLNALENAPATPAVNSCMNG